MVCINCGGVIMYGGPPCCDGGKARRETREAKEEAKEEALEKRLLAIEERLGEVEELERLIWRLEAENARF